MIDKKLLDIINNLSYDDLVMLKDHIDSRVKRIDDLEINKVLNMQGDLVNG